MAKNNKADMSCARVKKYTASDVSKAERHNERKNETYENMNVIEERIPFNVHFKKPFAPTYMEQLKQMETNGLVSLRGLRKDATLFNEIVIDVNTMYFERNGGYEYAKQFYEEAYHFIEEKFGADNIISAVMHADEINVAATEKLGKEIYHYHLHAMVLPVVEKEILWSKRCKDEKLRGTVKEVVNQISHSKKWKSDIPLTDEDNSYAFRVDGGGYSVLLRLTPNRGEHNVYAYCYSREALDRTLAEMQDARAQAYAPVYRHSAAHAREAGELEAWRASHKENVACREAIDGAIAKYFDGAHLDSRAASEVLDAYGAERVAWVLANSVITKEYDGRFSRGNRAWAQAENIPIDWTKPGYVHNDEFASRSHPAVLDGYIQMARREMETPAVEKSATIAYPVENRQRRNLRESGARTGAEKTEQPGRPSMRSLLREKQAQTRADGAPQKQPSRTPKRESR